MILQTHYPDHPALRAVLSLSYAEQAKLLLEQRRSAGLPPFGQLVILHCDCADADYAEGFLGELRKQLDPELPAGVSLVGPLPSPLSRRAGRPRCQLLVFAPDRGRGRAAAAALVAIAEAQRARRGLNWSVDVDPVDLY